MTVMPDYDPTLPIGIGAALAFHTHLRSWYDVISGSVWLHWNWNRWLFSGAVDVESAEGH